jgi:ABC-2 type transport system permease protein
MTLSFWLIRLDNLFVALDTVYSVGRTPIDVFRAWGSAPQFFLSYILPIAFFAAMPVKALFGRANSAHLIIAGPALAVFFLSVSALFWSYATRSYSSASS